MKVLGPLSLLAHMYLGLECISIVLWSSDMMTEQLLLGLLFLAGSKTGSVLV